MIYNVNWNGFIEITPGPRRFHENRELNVTLNIYDMAN